MITSLLKKLWFFKNSYNLLQIELMELGLRSLDTLRKLILLFCIGLSLLLTSVLCIVSAGVIALHGAIEGNIEKEGLLAIALFIFGATILGVFCYLTSERNLIKLFGIDKKIQKIYSNAP